MKFRRVALSLGIGLSNFSDALTASVDA